MYMCIYTHIDVDVDVDIDDVHADVPRGKASQPEGLRVSGHEHLHYDSRALGAGRLGPC